MYEGIQTKKIGWRYLASVYTEQSLEVFMHNPYEIIANGGELRIGGLGDSLTYGWMVRRGFFDRFCDTLAERYSGSRIVRYNEGIPGATAQGGHSRLSALLSHEPHMVLVQFGLNDVFGGVSPESFAESLSMMVDLTMKAGILLWLVVSSPLTIPGEHFSAESHYNVIRELGNDRGVPVADLDEYWRLRHDPTTREGAFFLEDHVHPNEKGHTVMAEGLVALWDSWAIEPV